MTVSFGYEKEHYDLSMKIGELALFPAVRNREPYTIIAAHDTSCPLLMLASPPTFFFILVKKKIILYLLMEQNYNTEFLTGTIYNWEHLLATEDFKNIILESFQWLVNNKKAV